MLSAKPMNETPSKPNEKFSRRPADISIYLIVATFVVYYFSNPQPQYYYDYTFRVADNLLGGATAFRAKPPSWLNEFVPFEGNWYSVFPLGSVLTMIPFAFFKFIGAIKEMPAALIAALTASASGAFLLAIAEKYEHTRNKKILLICGILFGTWMWTNLAMAGAWQLALGFAILGELGAIYFAVFNRRPFLAGVFFALAFGNRTEILLTAPILMFLLLKNSRFQISDSKFEDENLRAEVARKKSKKKNANSNLKPNNLESGIWNLQSAIWKTLARFCAVPFVLGVATLVYNYVRFHSFADFGYARIPGVLEEPWYNHGIFSPYYIPGQAFEMLWKPWERRAVFPFLVPNGFSSSILWSSPFVLLALRFGARDRIIKYAAWAAVFVLTLLLWMHGNSGGWQFGYRYAMVLLPWLFLILLENSPPKINLLEWAAYGLSFIINAYATYLFFWTNYLKP